MGLPSVSLQDTGGIADVATILAAGTILTVSLFSCSCVPNRDLLYAVPGTISMAANLFSALQRAAQGVWIYLAASISHRDSAFLCECFDSAEKTKIATKNMHPQKFFVTWTEMALMFKL